MTGGQTGYPSVDRPWMKYYTEAQIKAPLPECSLYEYLWNQNKEHLDDYALNYFGNKITYGKLFDMIDEAARAFIAIGVKEKEVVPVVSVSTVTSIVCFYAINKIGAVSDFINVLLEEDGLQDMFEEVDARVVVTLDLFGTKVINAAKKAGVKTVVTFGVNNGMPCFVNLGYKAKMAGKMPMIPEFGGLLQWNEFIKQASDVKEGARYKNPNEMCLLAHTGGTTGAPKAVMLSDKAMNIVANYYKLCFQYGREEVWANVMIPFVVYGILTCLHVPLTLGITIAVIPKFDGKDWKKYFKKYHINYIMAVPAYVNILYENEAFQNLDISSLKQCGVGGDGMTPEKEEKLNAYFQEHGSNINVLKGYGMSELCATAVTCLAGVNKIGSVGIPLIHNNIKIVDTDSNRELAYHEVGEICIQSPSRMIGYFNNSEATNDLFRIHEDGKEWLHTGDLGYIDRDGFLFLVGRMKRVILTTKDGIAYKVFPNMVEKALDEHNGVIQSCIVGACDGNDQVLCAHIVVRHDDMEKVEALEKELRTMCREHLPSYSRPTFYRFCENLPLTAAGKVDYRVLEEHSSWQVKTGGKTIGQTDRQTDRISIGR